MTANGVRYEPLGAANYSGYTGEVSFPPWKAGRTDSMIGQPDSMIGPKHRENTILIIKIERNTGFHFPFYTVLAPSMLSSR